MAKHSAMPRLYAAGISKEVIIMTHQDEMISRRTFMKGASAFSLLSLSMWLGGCGGCQQKIANRKDRWGRVSTFDICAVADVIRESFNRYIGSGENTAPQGASI
jgi:hypothetical protein